MQSPAFFDSFMAKRPSFIINTLLLIVVMVLYPLTGVLLLALCSGNASRDMSLLVADKSLHSMLRSIQAFGQVVTLALPVLFLAARHTGRKNPFSRDSLAFLGIRRNLDVRIVFFAVGGIFLLQPLLHTITSLQDIYLWPLLGNAGAEVIRQRNIMDSFIRELALAHNVPEFLQVAVVFSLVPALCEELFFRGYIQQNYEHSLSPGGAVLLTGSVFAFFHLSAANLLPLALLGWYIGYIYSKSGNLAVPFFVHFINNLAALLVLLLTETDNGFMVSWMKFVVETPLNWLVVAGSMFLFVTVILRFFSTLTPASPKSDVLPEQIAKYE